MLYSGAVGWDTRRLNFDDWTMDAPVTVANAFIIQWSGGGNTVNLFGDAMVSQVAGGVLTGLSGGQMTRIQGTVDGFQIIFADDERCIARIFRSGAGQGLGRSGRFHPPR